jgi:DNA-binding response OmpR family regulator
MLPLKEGLEVLKCIHKQNITTPVLILTAKDSIKDRIEGLDSGADDYLIKPFSKEELLARIRALSRRQIDAINNEEFAAGTMRFNPLRGEMDVKGRLTRLSPKASQILEIMFKNKVIAKDQLLYRIRGFKSDVELNNIEV